jgi:tRNA pseudouridine55 synthase
MLRRPAPLSWLGGFVVLDKPPMMTSTACCNRMRRFIDAERVGHAGTLDPTASGVLPLALNGATKALQFVMVQDKCYRFTVRWGAETDTDDVTGRVVRRVPDSAVRVSSDDLERVLDLYRHRELSQLPPQYSALRINGERAHDIARRGQHAPLLPRPVRINEFFVEQADAASASFFVRVSRGTYVRSLARDIGRDLGVLGHVTALRRTSVGPFGEDDAVSFEQLADATDVMQFLRPIASVLSMPVIRIKGHDAVMLSRGTALTVDITALERAPDELENETDVAPPVPMTTRERRASRFLAVNSVDESPIAITELHGSQIRPVQIFAVPEKIAAVEERSKLRQLALQAGAEPILADLKRSSRRRRPSTFAQAVAQASKEAHLASGEGAPPTISEAPPPPPPAAATVSLA